MSKRMICFIVLASLSVSRFAIGQQDVDDAGSQQIQAEDLVLRIPSTWSRMSDSKTVLTLLAPEPPLGGAFRDNIRVMRYSSRGIDDLDRIQAVQVNSVESQYKLIDSGVLQDADPRITWIATTERTPDPGRPLLAKIDYMTLHQGQVIVLHAMCETNAINERRQVFDEIARSIQFIQPPAMEQPFAPPVGYSPKSEAYKQGEKIGRYTLNAMIIAVVAWLLVRVVKSARK